MEVMPTSGKGTLGTWWFHFQRGGRTQSRHKPTHELELSYEQTIRSRGVCAPALEPRGEWEGSRTKCQGFKPDLGNSAVRQRVQEKASVLSGRQTHQGNSQKPCSLDSREERNRISDAYAPIPKVAPAR